MSYSLAGLGQTPPVRVGATARGDLVLAKASLAASKIVLQAAKRPAAERASFVARKLNAMQPGLARTAAAARRELLSKGKKRDQATFDAMRLAIANATLATGMDSLRATIARDQGAEVFAGLGQLSPNDRTTACTVTAGAQVVGGIASVVPVYGTIIGGLVSIGASIAGGQLDCTREQREAAAAAAQAQANLAAAQQIAAQQAAQRAAAARGNRMRVYVIGGGALVVALGIGYLLLG